MTCASCQHHVESALLGTAGVHSARVDLMGNRAPVVFDPAQVQPESLLSAIRSAGYDVVLPRTGEGAAQEDSLGMAGDAATSSLQTKAWTTLIAGAAAMLLAMPLASSMGALDHGLMRVLLDIERELKLPTRLELPDDALESPASLAAGVVSAVSAG